MNTVDAINDINQLQVHTSELVECLRENKSEASNLLISELEEIVKSVINENKLPVKNVTTILQLITEFQIKEAFQYLDMVLSNDMVSYFNLNLFMHTVCSSVTEMDLPILKKYINCSNYHGDTRLVAYVAIKTILNKKNEDGSFALAKDLETFLSNTLTLFPSLDRVENHILLNCLYADCCNIHSYKLCLKLKDLLKQLIIEDSRGYNCSWFKDYFKWLYQLEPTLSYTIQEIKRFVYQYKKQLDNEVFTFATFEAVGKHILYKASSVIELATPDIVKLAMKQMRAYPYNSRPEPITDEDYYSEICSNADIYQIPKIVLEQVREQYKNIFGIDLKKVVSMIVSRKSSLEKIKSELEQRKSKIIEENNREGKKIKLNIESNISALDGIGIELKKCEAEMELLVFYEEQLNVLQTSFCQGNTEEATEIALKKIAFSFATYSANDLNKLQVENYFDEYRRIIEQIYSLIGLDNTINSNDLIFDKVIFLPFLKKITEGKLFGQEGAEAYKEQLHYHPLNPKSLMEARSDTNKYIGLLEQYSSEAVNNIRTVFSESIALRPRKNLVEKCLCLFLDNEYEMFVNTIPIQIEGMFDDLMRSMVFELFTDLNLHPNAVLRDKIEILKKKSVNSFFEVEAYFKYYFNSTIRNTVAHGRFSLLSDSNGTCKKLALELLYGLNYFADTIFSINELDAMNEYINTTVMEYKGCKQESDINIFYDCLFSDLNGSRNCLRKSNYKSGVFKSYSSKQILWWIFNPFYESIYIYPTELNALRNLIKSPTFWNYILQKLNEQFMFSLFDKDEFKSVVQVMFSLADKDSETIEVLKDINRILNK